MIPLSDLLYLAVIVGGAALVVAALGWVALRLLRGRSVVLVMVVVAVVTVAATLAGIAVAAMAMFINAHDRSVLFALVILAGATGLAVAVVLGRGLANASRVLQTSARHIGGPEFTRPPAHLTTRLPAELAHIAHEITDTHQRITELRAREHALEASRRELIAFLSHDLRTPLAGLRAMAEALEDQLFTDRETTSRYHKQILTETDRLTHMVDDLFELSRIHTHTLRLDPKPVSLRQLVHQTTTACHPLADTKRIHLAAYTNPDAVIQADPTHLERALKNLITNAIQHTPPNKTIDIQASRENSTACIAIQDHCGGIPDQDLPRLFDIAYRGTTARTPTDSHGAGLGLAITKGIIHAHHGHISVTNTGPGCRFLIQLPLSQ